VKIRIRDLPPKTRLYSDRTACRHHYHCCDTAVVTPAYLKISSESAFDATTREIQDAFAHARERAVANDATVTLSFDPQSETLLVSVQPPAPPVDQRLPCRQALMGRRSPVGVWSRR